MAYYGYVYKSPEMEQQTYVILDGEQRGALVKSSKLERVCEMLRYRQITEVSLPTEAIDEIVENMYTYQYRHMRRCSKEEIEKLNTMLAQTGDVSDFT